MQSMKQTVSASTVYSSFKKPVACNLPPPPPPSHFITLSTPSHIWRKTEAVLGKTVWTPPPPLPILSHSVHHLTFEEKQRLYWGKLSEPSHSVHHLTFEEKQSLYWGKLWPPPPPSHFITLSTPSHIWRKTGCTGENCLKPPPPPPPPSLLTQHDGILRAFAHQSVSFNLHIHLQEFSVWNIFGCLNFDYDWSNWPRYCQHIIQRQTLHPKELIALNKSHLAGADCWGSRPLAERQK